MKKLRKIIPIAILFIAGLSLLLYPLIANQWNNYRQQQLMTDYSDVVSELEASGSIDYDAEWARAQAYNNALFPTVLPDSFAIAEAEESEDETYMACLNITDDGMMGTVEIPKINITIPIFHTTEESVLEKAAGHLEGSSLPIGGESTHAVIAAHRGLPSASLFTDLDQLEIGDHFLINVLNDTLAYEVDQILVVEPEETEALAVEAGADYVTLLTCTPYGVNTQRLLVRGHRVAYEPEVIEEEEAAVVLSLHTNYILWVIIGLGVTFIVIILLFIIERRRMKKRLTKAADAKTDAKEMTAETSESTDVPADDKKTPLSEGEEDRPDQK